MTWALKVTPHGASPQTQVEATPLRSDILDTAKRLITGDRNKSYGSFAVQCEKLSQIWSAVTGQTILPEHVGPILMGLKLVRITTAGDTDSEVDIAGYAALHAEAFKGAKPDAPEKT